MNQSICEQKDIAARLQEPFPANVIEWRVGSTNKEKTRGLALAYVTNRAIQQRLDDLFGPFGWRNEYREWKGSNQLCGISIRDSETGEWVTKWDGADDSNQDAVKGGLSDAMKRAGYQWGIGRYLYDLPSSWVEIEQRGNSCVIKTPPKLPKWALPRTGSIKEQLGDSEQVLVMGRSEPLSPEANAILHETFQEAFDDEAESKTISLAQLNGLYATALSRGYDKAHVDASCMKNFNKAPEQLNLNEFTQANRFYETAAIRSKKAS